MLGLDKFERIRARTSINDVGEGGLSVGRLSSAKMLSSCSLMFVRPVYEIDFRLSN